MEVMVRDWSEANRDLEEDIGNETRMAEAVWRARSLEEGVQDTDTRVLP